MKLVKHWKKSHKFWSNWCSVAAVISIVFSQIQPELRAALPPKVFAWVALVCVILGVIAKIFDQGFDKEDEDGDKK